MKRILAIAILGTMLSTAAHAQWTRTNGPSGGRFYALTADDSMIVGSMRGTIVRYQAGAWEEIGGQTFYGLQLAGGVLVGHDLEQFYRSSDYGASWTPIEPLGRILALGDSFFRIREDTLFISGDGARTWTKTGLLPHFATSLSLRHGDLFALSGIGNDSLYRSENAGATWTLVRGDLSVLRTSPTFLTATPDGLFLVLGQGDIRRSTDDGITWTRIAKGLPNATQINWISGNDAGTLAGGTDGCWRLVDDGWVKITSDENPQMPRPTSSGVVVATRRGPAVIDNDSAAARSIVEGLNHATVSALASTGGVVLATTGDRIVRSTSQGSGWGPSADFPGYSLVNDGPAVFALHGALHRTTDAGESWQQMRPLGAAEATFNAMVRNEHALFLGLGTAFNDGGTPRWVGGGILRSADGGTTWEVVNTGLPDMNGTFVPVRSLLAGKGYLIAGTAAGIYRSTDDGASWHFSSDGIPLEDGISAMGPLYSAMGSPIMITDAGPFVSGDDGLSWKSMTGDMPEDWESEVSVFGFEGVLYMQFENPSNDHLSTWAYDGEWIDITDSMPREVLLYTMTRSGDNIYAGSFGNGVWRYDETVASAPDEAEATLTLNAAPNPMMSNAMLQFSIPAQGPVRISLISVVGKVVTDIVNESLAAGLHSRHLDVSSLPRGTYFLRLDYGGHTRTQRVVVQ